MIKERICTWCDGLGYCGMKDKINLMLCPHCNGSGLEEYFSNEQETETEKQIKCVPEKSV